MCDSIGATSLTQWESDPSMKLNKLIAEVLSMEAIELLNVLAANALAAANNSDTSVFYLAVEEDNWNSTVLLMREIFEAEILISSEQDWLSFRVLESFGVKQGRLAYQFTDTFAHTLAPE